METFVTVIHVCSALFMILVVLIQGGNSGGVGAAFGGGNSQGVFGAAGATSFLGKLTYGFAGVFMATSIWLSVLQGNSGEMGIRERLEQAAGEKSEQKAGAEKVQSGKPEVAAEPTESKPADSKPESPEKSGQ